MKYTYQASNVHRKLPSIRPVGYSITGNRISYVLLAIVSAFSLFPFFWMLIVGSNTTAIINQFPPHVVPGPNFFINLGKAIDRSPFFTSLLNSSILSIAVSCSVLFLASLAGYAFAKLKFPFSRELFLFVIFTMMIPVQLGIVPLYMIMSNLGWVDSFKAVIVPGMVNAFGVFWMRQYIMTAVPDDLISAARIDGCGNFSVFLRIVVPVIQPAFATLGILTFMNTWNDFFWPSVVLQSREKLTIQLALRTLNDAYFQDHSMVLAATFVATLPLLIVFLVLNKQFIAGIAEGALK